MPRVRAMFHQFTPISTYILFNVQVGNQAFADYIDANLNITRINNKSALHIYFGSNESNYSSGTL